MKQQVFRLIFSTLLFLPLFGRAQSTSTLRLDEIQKSEKPNDIDKVITDARLRTQLGSKSKWSFKSSLTYSGSSISDPFNGVRSKIPSSATMQEMTTLKGTMGVNYRLAEQDNLSGGTGVAVVDPLHGDPMQSAQDTRSNRSGSVTRYEVATPYLAWSRGYRVSDVQMISSLMYAHATSNDAANIMKTMGMAYFNHTALLDLATRVSLSLNLIFIKFYYTGEVTDPMMVPMISSGIVQRPDMNATFLPSLQYSFGDRYSLRTGFNWFQFMRYENSQDNKQIEPSQSVGLGISVTRDIYFYPSIEFTPKNIRTDRTNVALLANINLF